MLMLIVKFLQSLHNSVTNTVVFVDRLVSITTRTLGTVSGEDI